MWQDSGLQIAIAADVRYDLLPEGVPGSESLAMVCKRVAPLWEERIAPALREGRTVMVVSHGNTLRALVKEIDGVSDEV
jgi:2,3-bisphosphoglycerate-dependent phosphoglycerate mutase